MTTAPEMLCGAESLWPGITCQKVPHPGDDRHLAEDGRSDYVWSTAAVEADQRGDCPGCQQRPCACARLCSCGQHGGARWHDGPHDSGHEDPHPADWLQWTQTAKGDHTFCDHCGEPVPCAAGALRHQQGDYHKQFCRAVRRCYYVPDGSVPEPFRLAPCLTCP